MDDLQSEKEQIEEIRAWWSENGRYIIIGIVIVVGGIFGFNQYKGNKAAAEIEASVLFETLAGHVDGGELDAAARVAAELETDYANTAYAAQSKLAMAKLYMDKNRDEDAANVLRELVSMRGNRGIRNVGRARLARILLYQDKAQEVVDLLEGLDEPAFEARYAESLGDAWAALGDVEKATGYYQTAMADTEQTVDRRLVQMKLVDLPAPEAIAEPAEAATEDATEEMATEEVETEEPATEAADVDGETQ